jgi:hypothetical protein
MSHYSRPWLALCYVTHIHIQVFHLRLSSLISRLSMDFYEIYNADMLDREDSTTNSKITSSKKL